MKKSIIIFLALLLTLFLYACSDSDASGNNSNDNGDAKTVKPRIGLPGGYDVTSKGTIDEFIEEHPEIDVEIEEGPWGEYVQQIVTRIAGDTAPDIWFQENAVILGYGERGVAVELTPYIENDVLNEDDYVDALFASQTADGELYGIPHGINPIALAYNKEIFEENDVPFPTDEWTYEDMIEVAKELTLDTDGDGKTELYGFNVTAGITRGWFPWIKAADGQVLDESLTESRMTDPNTIEGLSQWSAMINDLEISPTSDFSKASGGDVFQNGLAAMEFIQYDKQDQINNDDFPDLDYDTVMISKTFSGEDRYVPMVVNSWLIYSQSDQEQKDAAWEFLKYYLGEESQKNLADSGGSLPLSKKALEELEADTLTKPNNKAAYTKGIEEAGTTMDENATWQEWRHAANPLFDDILNGILPVEGGFEQIDKAFRMF